MLDSRPITLTDAVSVGRILRRHPLVQHVEVFGSVAREGCGNDLHLLLEVPAPLAVQFILETIHRLAGKINIAEPLRCVAGFALVEDYKNPREAVAVLVLGPEFAVLLTEAKTLLPVGGTKTPIDLLLFPPQWRTCAQRLQENSTLGPEFWHALHQDAIPVR